MPGVFAATTPAEVANPELPMHTNSSQLKEILGGVHEMMLYVPYPIVSFGSFDDAPTQSNFEKLIHGASASKRKSKRKDESHNELVGGLLESSWCSEPQPGHSCEQSVPSSLHQHLQALPSPPGSASICCLSVSVASLGEEVVPAKEPAPLTSAQPRAAAATTGAAGGVREPRQRIAEERGSAAAPPRADHEWMGKEEARALLNEKHLPFLLKMVPGVNETHTGQ